MKVALDLDDVIGAFYPGFCEYSGRPEVKTNIWDGKVACKWIADTIHVLNDEPDFWANLELLSRPSSINFNVVAYITASPQSMVDIRAQWLYEHGFPPVPVIHSKDKLSTMDDVGADILVDDSPRTVAMINAGGKIGLQFKPPYMTAEIERKDRIITHLSEVGEFIKDHTYEYISRKY